MRNLIVINGIAIMTYFADDLVEAVTEAETCSREVAIRIGDSGDKTTDLADKVESLAKIVKREQDEVERSVDAPSFFSLSFSFPLPPPLFLLPPPLGCRHIYIKPLNFKYTKLRFTMRKSNIKKPPNNAKKFLKTYMKYYMSCASLILCYIECRNVLICLSIVL